MCVRACVNAYVRACVCQCARVCARVPMRASVRTCAYVRMCACAYVRACVCAILEIYIIYFIKNHFVRKKIVINTTKNCNNITHNSSFYLIYIANEVLILRTRS